MVRRGSTVRVRQRALQKTRSRPFSFRIDLQKLECGVGMEPFMEPSGRKRRRKGLAFSPSKLCQARMTGSASTDSSGRGVGRLLRDGAHRF